MAELFADTSGWGHLVAPTQPFHALAANIYRTARKQGRKIVTTNYILAELVALLTSPLRIPRPHVVTLINGLKNSPFVEVVHVDLALDARRMELVAKSTGQRMEPCGLREFRPHAAALHNGSSDNRPPL